MRETHTLAAITTMQQVDFWEHSSTNSGEYIIAHLACGHTRTFNGNQPVGNGQVHCWKCYEAEAQ